MAGYVNATVVYARNAGRTFTASSRPATQMVQDFIDDTAAELDAILRMRGYDLPVQGATSALKTLEHGNALGAGFLIEQSAPSGSPDKLRMAFELWKSFKDALQVGDLELDAPADNASSDVRHALTSSATAMFVDRPAQNDGLQYID